MLAAAMATETGRTREHSCVCGRALGVVTRDRGGPVVLTPYPGVTLAQITGGVVWLLCPCGVTTPWFLPKSRQLRETG